MSFNALSRTAPLLLVAAALALPTPAAAQDANPADNEAFLRGLAEMGLDGLILKIAQAPPTNPEEAAGLRDALINAYLPVLKRQSMDAYFDGVRMLQRYQSNLLGEPANRNYWARPVWMADFARLMMFSALPEATQAGDFALLGFPDADQRKAVDLVAGDAFQQLARADDEQLRLAAILRAEPDFEIDYINTGRWQQLKDYSDLNIPFYRAWAVVYLLTQADDGPYFAARQQEGESPASARAKLVKRATLDLDKVQANADALNLQEDTRARVHLLRGLLAIEQSRYDEALKELGTAGTFGDAEPYTKLLVDLARAKALQKSGKEAETRQLLDDLAGREFARANPLTQVLIADRRFFIKYDQALRMNDPERQRPVISEAFQAYDELLSSDRLGEYKGPITAYVEQRYKDQVPPGLPADQLPPTLRFAKVRGLVEQAENLLADERLEEAKARQAEAIEACRAFLKTDDLPAGIRAQTKFYLGFMQLRAGQAGYALQTLVETAEEFPDQEWGEQAAQIAVVNLARPIYRAQPDNDAVKQLYERALKAAIEKYPSTELGRLSTYDLAAFYRETERYRDAVVAYGRVPRDHPAYVSAQYEKLACLGALWADAAAQERVALAQQIVPASRDFVDLAERALPDRSPEDQRRLREYMASAELLRASVLLETMNQPGDAAKVIEQVQRRFGQIESIKPRITGLNIRIYQKAGEYDKARQAILQYMQDEPEKAGPLAAGVLKSLIDQVEELSAAKAPPEQINRLADVAVELAEQVALPWAGRQADMDVDQQIAYRLIPADALLAANRPTEALERYEQIVQKFGQTARNNIDVIMGMAESQYRLKQYAPASVAFNRIIKFYHENGTAKDSTYWHAYMRVMQMVDAESQGKNTDIFLRLRNLKRANPDFGGEPYKSVLNALLEKNAP